NQPPMGLTELQQAVVSLLDDVALGKQPQRRRSPAVHLAHGINLLPQTSISWVSKKGIPDRSAQQRPRISGRRKDDTLARLVRPPSQPSRLRDYDLSFFCLLASISHSRFSPPNSAAPFPLSLSPSIVSLYSTVMPSSIPANFRSAENVSVPSFSFRSLSLVASWSGQLIVPARLAPSFLIFKVDVRCCPPISYSHFHVPTGSTTLSSAAPARPHTPRTNAIERIAF